MQRPPPEKRDACAFHMQGPFCPGRAFCGLSAGSVFSKHRLEYQAWPKAAPTACAGPARACFWHTAQSARIFPFPRPASPRPLFQRRGPALAICRWQPAPPGAGAKAFYRPPLAAPSPQGHFALFRKKIPGKAGKTANRAEYREKLRQAKIITPGRAGMQNAARPKRGARHFLPVFCSKHAPQAPVLGLPLSPLLPGEGGVLPSSYS